MAEHLWWHAFGRVIPEGEFAAGAWQLVVYGESDMPPAQARRFGPQDVPWLASWDHEPSDAEKDTVTPEEYRDEAPASL